jgi:hypothetical protein
VVPSRVRTAAPIRPQTVKTSASDSSFSAGSHAGSSIVNGRTSVLTDCIPFSSTSTTR